MDLRERGGSDRRHPWELARARFFRRLLADHVDLIEVGSALDIGAGDSWFASQLAQDVRPGTPIVCWDVNYDADELATAPPGVTRTATAPAGPFAVVTALDVLEHVDDEHAFLAEQLVAALAPGGLALVSVPAHPALYADHDRMLEHRRRYRPQALRDLVGRHLDVVDHGSLFASLLGPRAAAVVLERAGRHGSAGGVGRWERGPLVTAAVTSVLELDARAGRWLGRHGVALPGLSTWVVARRPDARS